MHKHLWAIECQKNSTTRLYTWILMACSNEQIAIGTAAFLLCWIWIFFASFHSYRQCIYIRTTISNAKNLIKSIWTFHLTIWRALFVFICLLNSRVVAISDAFSLFLSLFILVFAHSAQSYMLLLFIIFINESLICLQNHKRSFLFTFYLRF